jgi:pyruvate,water dikinase
MTHIARILPADHGGLKDEPTLTAGITSLLPFMGGKAANLHRLTNQGIPVPAWVCVSSRVCSVAIAEQQSVIERYLAGMDYESPASIQLASDAIRGLVERTSIPESIRRDVERSMDDMGASHYAVRSSGLVEDSSEGSYAGQFDTYLYVTRADVLDRIKSCWASAFTTRNLVYMRRMGVTEPPASVAVVVQVMCRS